jgi:hypothetical protein
MADRRRRPLSSYTISYDKGKQQAFDQRMPALQVQAESRPRPRNVELFPLGSQKTHSLIIAIFSWDCQHFDNKDEQMRHIQKHYNAEHCVEQRVGRPFFVLHRIIELAQRNLKSTIKMNKYVQNEPACIECTPICTCLWVESHWPKLKLGGLKIKQPENLPQSSIPSEAGS